MLHLTPTSAIPIPEFGPRLHLAAWCGEMDAVELLLDAGADPMLID
jgi:hypothetical protein